MHEEVDEFSLETKVSAPPGNRHRSTGMSILLLLDTELERILFSNDSESIWEGSDLTITKE